MQAHEAPRTRWLRLCLSYAHRQAAGRDTVRLANIAQGLASFQLGLNHQA